MEPSTINSEIKAAGDLWVGTLTKNKRKSWNQLPAIRIPQQQIQSFEWTSLKKSRTAGEKERYPAKIWGSRRFESKRERNRLNYGKNQIFKAKQAEVWAGNEENRLTLLHIETVRNWFRWKDWKTGKKSNRRHKHIKFVGIAWISSKSSQELLSDWWSCDHFLR